MNMSITQQITTTTYTDKIKIGTPPHIYQDAKDEDDAIAAITVVMIIETYDWFWARRFIEQMDARLFLNYIS